MNITLELVDALCADARVVMRFMNRHDLFNNVGDYERLEEAVGFAVEQVVPVYSDYYVPLFDATLTEMKRREKEASRL